MNKFFLILVLFLISCSSPVTNNDFNKFDHMSFSEFKIKLDEYSNNNPYPNIDD